MFLRIFYIRKFALNLAKANVGVIRYDSNRDEFDVLEENFTAAENQKENQNENSIEKEKSSKNEMMRQMAQMMVKVKKNFFLIKIWKSNKRNKNKNKKTQKKFWKIWKIFTGRTCEIQQTQLDSSLFDSRRFRFDSKTWHN